MNSEPLEDLDALIAEEKRLVAEELFYEAWESGLQNGIDSDILAASFARKLMMHVTGLNGETAAGELLANLNRMQDSGDFVQNKTLQ